jgi:hypothetical protein
MLGAPQLAGRPNGKDTPGSGYVFTRDLGPPQTVVVPEEEKVVVPGDEANVFGGNINGNKNKPLSDFYFFDVGEISIEMGDQDDTFTIEEPGLTAEGLHTFAFSGGGGNNKINVNSDNLSAPAAGKFLYTEPDESNQNLQTQTLMAQAASTSVTLNSPERWVSTQLIEGRVTLDGGDGGNNRLIMEADADNIAVSNNEVTINHQTDVEVLGTDHLSLFGGDSKNRFQISEWNGELTVDGKEGSDQVEFQVKDQIDSTSELKELLDALEDSGVSGLDQLTLLGNVKMPLQQSRGNPGKPNPSPRGGELNPDKSKQTSEESLDLRNYEVLFTDDEITGLSQFSATTQANDDILNPNQ